MTWCAETGSIGCVKTIRRLRLSKRKACADIIDMNISDTQLDLVTQLMASASQRHRVISQNISNVNTPNYHTREVSFEKELESILSTDDLDAEQLATVITESEGLKERIDGNNVDLAREMGLMEKNSIIYSALSSVMASRLSILKTSITGQ